MISSFQTDAIQPRFGGEDAAQATQHLLQRDTGKGAEPPAPLKCWFEKRTFLGRFQEWFRQKRLAVPLLKPRQNEPAFFVIVTAINAQAVEAGTCRNKAAQLIRQAI